MSGVRLCDFIYSFIYDVTRFRPISCRRPIPDTISRSYTDTGLYKVFVLKMRFCAGYRCVQVIYVYGVCAKIWYRLETTGVRCNSVDC